MPQGRVFVADLGHGHGGEALSEGRVEGLQGSGAPVLGDEDDHGAAWPIGGGRGREGDESVEEQAGVVSLGACLYCTQSAQEAPKQGGSGGPNETGWAARGGPER